MAYPRILPFLVFLLCLSHALYVAKGALNFRGLPIVDDGVKNYIVLVTHANPSSLNDRGDWEAWYRSFLPPEHWSSGEDRLIYSYNRVITGFAARLTSRELEAVKQKPGFAFAFPDRIAKLQTTHTPDFLGLHRPSGVWRQTSFGRAVIVGVLDTGILPNHTSFIAPDLPKPPSKWKGTCDFPAAQCSHKIIGARAFLSGLRAMKRGSSMLRAGAPYDDNGHGTHVASTVAGWFVEDASYQGFARGTASGMAPAAHLAMYKVCGESGGCAYSDILMGMDTAVSDGVDILSVSLGGPPLPLHSDPVAIGGFGATEHGVLVSIAASNEGPGPNTVSNEAPWFLTVGAGTMDRSMVGTVKLGSGAEFYGESVFRSSFSSALVPLVYLSGSAASTCSNLTEINLSGKIALCDGGGVPAAIKASNVASAGGVAMIVANDKSAGSTKVFEETGLPTTRVSHADGVKIKAYVKSSGSKARATIVFEGTAIGSPPAPVVAAFSSRGPSTNSPSILKPDVIGPGVDVLAAWPFPVDELSAVSSFRLLSGTSMATPHLSGIAALLKASHPDWSPAAIKSAIITTATTVNSRGDPITDADGGAKAGYFATGAGQVDPPSADNPGLIYELKANDYIAYMCSINFTDDQVAAVSRRAVKCADFPRILPVGLNYPTFSLSLGVGEKITVSRSVTNVGCASSAYSSQINAPAGVSVAVSPTKLTFSKTKETKQYNITFTRLDGAAAGIREGALTWVADGGKTKVRSPIVVNVL